MQRYRLDKNGNKIPNAKCPKCGGGGFLHCTVSLGPWELCKCEKCNWTWDINDKGDGFYSDKQ